MGEGDAADGGLATFAAGRVRTVSRRVSRPPARAHRHRAPVPLPVQANSVVGTEVRLAGPVRCPALAGPGRQMLKGTRDGILKKVQPVSIHGQVTWDVFFTDVDDPDGQVTVARIGPEAVMGTNLEPGDRIQVEYLVGVAIKVTRVVPTQ